MSRLANDQLLCPRDMVDNDLGVGLVYPLDERFQRLDLWLADRAGQVPAAASSRCCGRWPRRWPTYTATASSTVGLSPHAVLVRPLPDDNVLRVTVGDWLSAGTRTGSPLTGVSGAGVSGLMDASEDGGPGPAQAGGGVRLGGVPMFFEEFQAKQARLSSLPWTRNAG